MTKKLISILFVMVSLPSLAYAQTYRCQSSNGSIAFQDHACQKGATASTIHLSTYHPNKAPTPWHADAPAVQPSSRDARYPYAREGDVERLKAANDEVQALNKRMKEENPNWQHDQTWTRLNAEAEALNKQIQK